MSRALPRLAFFTFATAMLASCQTANPGYRQAPSATAFGYQEQIIETNRFQVSYRGQNAREARDFALLRAAELTLANGADWFEVVSAYQDREASPRYNSGSGVNVGGSVGSGGRSSVGVGIGIGIPLGGGAQQSSVTQHMEIVIGKGEKPDTPKGYNAHDVQANLCMSGGCGAY